MLLESRAGESEADMSITRFGWRTWSRGAAAVLLLAWTGLTIGCRAGEEAGTPSQTDPLASAEPEWSVEPDSPQHREIAPVVPVAEEPDIESEPDQSLVAEQPVDEIETAEGEPEPAVVEPFPGVVVHPDSGIVELAGVVCLDVGWLEQIACEPNSREHESLIVPVAEASQVHAALLMAGHEPGRPGRWRLDEEQEFRFEPPVGSELDVWVRHGNEAGEPVEEPIRNWIRDGHGDQPFSLIPWVFGGSRLEPSPEWMKDDGMHYVADFTGSIIGLVTFGDETVGFREVIADAASVHPPVWEANSEAMPPVGTEVVLILKPWVEPATGDAAIGE